MRSDGTQGDARVGDPPPVPRETDRDRHHGRRVGVLSSELDVGRRPARDGHLDLDEQFGGRQRVGHEAGVEVGERDHSPALRVSKGDARIEREQGDRNVAAGRRREQVAADGAHVADGPAGGAAGRLAKHRDVSLAQQPGQRRGGTDPQGPVDALEPVEAGHPEAHHRLGQRDPFVDQRHRDGPAGHHEQPRAVSLQHVERLRQRSRQVVALDGHPAVSSLARPPSDPTAVDGSRRNRASRLPRPWLDQGPGQALHETAVEPGQRAADLALTVVVDRGRAVGIREAE